MMQSLPVRGGEMDRSRISRTHGVRPGGDSKRDNHLLQAFRTTTTTGGLPAALWHPPERLREIPIVVPKGEVGSGVENRLPARMVTLGRSGPDSNPRRTCRHHPVEGVGLVVVVDLRADRPPLLTKVAGERVSQYPAGGALAQISPPLLPPLVGSWS